MCLKIEAQMTHCRGINAAQDSGRVTCKEHLRAYGLRHTFKQLEDPSEVVRGEMILRLLNSQHRQVRGLKLLTEQRRGRPWVSSYCLCLRIEHRGDQSKVKK